jgi:hypothetical protein
MDLYTIPRKVNIRNILVTFCQLFKVIGKNRIFIETHCQKNDVAEKCFFAQKSFFLGKMSRNVRYFHRKFMADHGILQTGSVFVK